MNKFFLSLMFFLFSTNSFAVNDYFYIQKISGEKIKVSTSDLESLNPSLVKTETIYTGDEEFTGVLFSDLFKKYNITGKYVRAFAWDDYSYSMSLGELENCRVIIAYKQNGEYLTIENLGPFAIIYPKDACHDLNKLDVNAKTVMQVKSLVVRNNE